MEAVLFILAIIGWVLFLASKYSQKGFEKEYQNQHDFSINISPPVKKK